MIRPLPPPHHHTTTTPPSPVASGVLDQISQEAGGTRERFQMMVVQMVNQAIWLGRRSGSDDQQLEDLINRVIINQ